MRFGHAAALDASYSQTIRDNRFDVHRGTIKLGVHLHDE